MTQDREHSEEARRESFDPQPGGTAPVQYADHVGEDPLDPNWTSRGKASTSGGKAQPLAKPDKATGSTEAAPGERPYVPLVVHDGAAMLDTPAEPRSWHVDDFLPAYDVTLLGADGGTGKTQLGLQLAFASAIGWTWCDIPIVQCRAIYYSAEETIGELKFRLHQIAKPVLGASLQPDGLLLVSVADDDAELATFDGRGAIEPTERFHDLERLVQKHGAGLLVLDAAADVFGGSELNRREVRAFIRMLRGLAIRNRCTILLLSHPSVDGMKTGRGYSGSTHWNNAVRSRWYFTTPANDKGEEHDADLRQLELVKSNRARKGQKIMLRWIDGVFVKETPMAASDSIARGEARRVFLDLLRELNRQGRPVSASPCSTYAPAVLSREPGAGGITKNALAYAMSELLAEGRIEVRESGRDSKRRKYLMVVEGLRDAA
jgi:RecA-family ATPase